ncbi:MAG: hypothetical protein ACLFQW_08560 [Spirochaetaceae bacterium]
MIGLDPTSTRKLRIPLSTVDEHFSPLRTFKGSIKEADFLRNHFSVRQFDALEEILIVPFHHKDTVIGLLIIADTSVSLDEQEEYLLSTIEELSNFMYTSRENFYTKPAGTLYQLEESVEVTKKLIEKAKNENQNLILIKLETKRIVEHLLSCLDKADPYRLRQDILRIISSMAGENGRVIYSHYSHCILLIEAKSLTRGKILLHQIYNSLNSYFALKDAPLPQISSLERQFPRDGDTAEKLLEGLI